MYFMERFFYKVSLFLSESFIPVNYLDTVLEGANMRLGMEVRFAEKEILFI